MAYAQVLQGRDCLCYVLVLYLVQRVLYDWKRYPKASPLHYFTAKLQIEINPKTHQFFEVLPAFVK